MKLKDWADREGISYITAYRWFKSGKLPVNAYQTDTGTIIVEDEVLTSPEVNMQDNKSLSDSPVSKLIKKAFEISKSGAPVEDLATFVISNFRLEAQTTEPDRIMKSRQPRVSAENHFKKFMKPAGKNKPESTSFLINEKNLDQVMASAAALNCGAIEEVTNPEVYGTIVTEHRTVPQNNNLQSIVSDMSAAMRSPTLATPLTYSSGDAPAFNRSLEDGPVQFNSTLYAAVSGSVSNFDQNSMLFQSNGFASNNAASSYATGTTLTESTIPNSNISSTYSFVTPTLMNEVSTQPYNPVTYDEARSLVNLMNKGGDPLAIDRQAKEICKLNRDTYEMMLSSAGAKRI